MLRGGAGRDQTITKTISSHYFYYYLHTQRPRKAKQHKMNNTPWINSRWFSANSLVTKVQPLDESVPRREVRPHILHTGYIKSNTGNNIATIAQWSAYTNVNAEMICWELMLTLILMLMR